MLAGHGLWDRTAGGLDKRRDRGVESRRGRPTAPDGIRGAALFRDMRIRPEELRPDPLRSGKLR